MTEIVTRRLNASLYPPLILDDPGGGIVLAASQLPPLDGERRAVALIVDVQALGLPNPSAAAANCLEQVIGYFAPILVQEYDLAPDSRIHWIKVDSIGAFDVARPEFALGARRYQRVSVVCTPLRCAPGAPRTVAAFRAVFREVAETLLRSAMALAGSRGDWP